ncbi:MAG: hypothetical protein EA376_03970 [Phycisphaeraceae bacterium]|nr:MAG: hypothetical protein EA376_03970 [Phycisphaeraceae bacterium]
MLKFFRKYNKIILAVGGTLLMIVFLMPEAIQQLGGNPMKRAIASVDGRKVTEMDLQQAEQELRIIEGVGMLGQVGNLGPLPIEDRDHWYMLALEAERGGFFGGPQDGRNLIPIMARSMVLAEFPPDLIRQLGTEVVSQQIRNLMELMERRREALIMQGTPEDRVDMALAKAHGVRRMLETYLGSGNLSDLEAIHYARRFFDEVKVDYALIRAEYFEREYSEPSEDAMREHFERYRDVRAGAGEHGFGYMREPAVALEWVMVDRNTVLNAVRLNPVDVRAHWQRNRDRFPSEFSDERGRIESELRREAADNALREAERIIRAEALRTERALQEDGRFRRLPDGWNQNLANLSPIADRVNEALREQYNVREDAAEQRSGPLATENAMNQTLDSRILNSRLQFGPRSIPFMDFIFTVRELDQSSPFGLQRGVIFPNPLQGPNGELIFIRVNNVRPLSQPESMELIRGVVARDLRTLEAFRNLESNLDAIRRDAIDSFNIAATERGARVNEGVGVRKGGMQTTQGQTVPGNFNNETVRDAIMARGRELDPRTSIDNIDLADRIMVIPLPDTLEIAMVRIMSLEPVPIEMYRLWEPQLLIFAQQERFEESGGDFPFLKSVMQDRLKFERTRASLAEEEEEEEFERQMEEAI